MEWMGIMEQWLDVQTLIWLFPIMFVLHAFTHIGQSIILRSLTPGVFTSLIVIIPYSLVLYRSLLVNEVITWEVIFVCLPFCLLIIPVALLAHRIGKK